MSASSSSSSGGIGLTGAATLLFVALKLTGNVSWPWLWVLSPLWISFLIAVCAIGVFFLIDWFSWRSRN